MSSEGENAKKEEDEAREREPSGRFQTKAGLHLLSGSSHLNTPWLGTRGQQPRGLGAPRAFSVSDPEATSTVYTLIKKQRPWRANAASRRFSILLSNQIIPLSPPSLESLKGSKQGGGGHWLIIKSSPGCLVEVGGWRPGGHGEVSQEAI